MFLEDVIEFIVNIVKKVKRCLYVKAMMKAIDHAREPFFLSEEKESKTCGLRAIRTFEKINNVEFNPHDKTYFSHICGNAHHEAFFRRVKIILKREVIYGSSKR